MNNKEKNIITIATFIGFSNRGAEMLLKTRISSLKKLVPNAWFQVLSIYTEECLPIDNTEYIDTFGARAEKFKNPFYLLKTAFRGIFWSINAVLRRLLKFSFSSSINKIAKSKLMVSTDGDILGEDYGILPFIWRLYYLSLGLFLKIPVVIYAEGCGPFKSALGKFLGKCFFSRCSYISVRDEISKDELIAIGIKAECIDIVADSAFLFSKSDYILKRGKEEKIIGISLSKLALSYGFSNGDKNNSYEQFLHKASTIIEDIIQSVPCKVIMITHVNQVNRNDWVTANDIYNRMHDSAKGNIQILPVDMSTEDVKAVISQCDLVVAARMHAAISALSCCVPVLGISYSHKMPGLLKRFGLEKYMIDISDFDENLSSLIVNTLDDSDKIKAVLNEQIPMIKKMSEKPALAAVSLITGH